MKVANEKYPLRADSPLVQKIIVFLPIGVLTLSTLATMNSLNNLLNMRLTEINLASIYAIMATLMSLSNTIAGPIGGKLSDTFGRKKTALIGLALMAAANLVIGSVRNAAALMVAYVIFGLAYGTVFPLSSAMVADVMDKDDVPAYIGYAQGLMSFGSIVIPIFTGWLTKLFPAGTAINSLLIFSVISWFLILFLFPDMGGNELTDKKSAGFDWTGLALMFLFVAPLTIGLTLGGKNIPWFSLPSIALYLCSIICLVLFIKHIKTTENAIIDPALFKIKGFIPVNLIAMLTFPTVALIGSYLIKYAQDVLKFTAAQTGSWSIRRFVPVILSPLIGFWLSKTAKKSRGYRVALIFGGFVEILSVALLFFCLKEGTPGWLILLSLCLFQAGAAFENSPVKALIASSMPINMRGSGLAIQSYISSCISTIYIAIAGVFYNSMDFTSAMVCMIIVALVCLVIRQLIAFSKLKDLNV